MDRPLKAALKAAIIAIITTGAFEAAFAKAENDFFQFCTTKAYGWPAPWKIDYCECEGAKITFPTISKIVNLSTIAGSGIVGFVLVGGISLVRQRHD